MRAAGPSRRRARSLPRYVTLSGRRSHSEEAHDALAGEGDPEPVSRSATAAPATAALGRRRTGDAEPVDDALATRADQGSRATRPRRRPRAGRCAETVSSSAAASGVGADPRCRAESRATTDRPREGDALPASLRRHYSKPSRATAATATGAGSPSRSSTRRASRRICSQSSSRRSSVTTGSDGAIRVCACSVSAQVRPTSEATPAARARRRAAASRRWCGSAR